MFHAVCVNGWKFGLEKSLEAIVIYSSVDI